MTDPVHTLKHQSHFVRRPGFPSCFVTGTDTDAGKTIATACLLRFLGRNDARAVGLKPIASGFDYCETGRRLKNTDIERLKQASNVALAEELVNQYAFEPAIAPHIAAAQEGVEIDLARVQKAVDGACLVADTVLVEGVGGWRVPLRMPSQHQQFIGNLGDGSNLRSGHSVAALAKHLNLPVILVVGMRLGCLNHALLTAQAIVDDGLPLVGWVANTVDPNFACLPENLETLKSIISAPLLFEIPYLGDASRLESYVPETVALNEFF